MKVFIGADHRGFELKNKLVDWLKTNGYEAEDCGAFSLDPHDDYPDFAEIVGENVSSNKDSRGILICRSGVGVDIVANKNLNIRCGLGFNAEQIRKTRNDDNINVLALAADFTDTETARELVKVFLQTDYQQTENHQRRIEKIKKLEGGV